MFQPDLNAPLSEKRDKKFGLAFARGLETWHLMQIQSPNFPRSKWAENYQYAHGTQSYLRTIQPVENLAGNDSQTLPGADLRNMKLLSTILESVVGKLNKQSFKPTVTMVDSLAEDQRNDMKARLELAMIARQQGAEMEAYLKNLGLSPDDVPISQEDLNLTLATLPQFREEMALELALSKVNKESALDTLLRMTDYDDTITGTRCLYVNTSRGQQQIEWVDVLNAGHSMSMYPDGRDIVWSYRIRPVPVETIKLEAAGDLTPEQLKSIRGGNWTTLYNVLYFWDQNQGNNGYTPYFYNTYTDYALVLDFEFVSTETQNINYKNGKLFPPSSRKRVEGRDGEVYDTKIQHLFGGSYIIGNQFLYNYGQKEGIRQPLPMNLRDATRVNASKVYGSFIWQHSSMIRGSSTTLVDRAKPHLDSIETLFKKFKTYSAGFMPWILRVDQDALVDLAFKEGSEVTPEDLMTTLLSKGVAVVSSSAYRGFHNSSVKDAITLIENAGAPNLQMAWNLILQQINLVRDVMGVPSVEMGGSVNPEQGKAVTQSIIAGSDNVLSGLMEARVRLVSNLWENRMYHILASGESGISPEGLPFDVPVGNPDGRIPNLIVEPVPQEQEWMVLYNAANQALAAKTLTMDQFAFIKNITNLKQAWAYLATQQRRGEMRQSQQQQMVDQTNTERQMLSNQQAQAGKMELERAKGVNAVIAEWAKIAFAPPQTDENGKTKKVASMEEATLLLQQAISTLTSIYGESGNTSGGASPELAAGADSGELPAALEQ